MNRLHLHIGSYKTGTTSIQRTFFDNDIPLGKQGFVYPRVTQNDHLLYFATNAEEKDWPRQFKSFKEKTLNEYLEKYFSSLEDDFNLDMDQYILSTEYLFIHNREHIKNVVGYLNDFFEDIKVYLFVRFPIDYYRSYQQQRIKARSYIAPPTYFKYEFKKVANAWNEVADLQIIPYESGVNSCEVLCDKIGINYHKLSTPDEKRNASLSVEQMCLLSKIQRYFYQSCEDRFKKHLGIIDKVNTSFTHKAQLQDWVSPVIYDNHFEDLQWLKNKYSIDFLSQELESQEVASAPTFENGMATVRDIYKVPSEETVEKYEALVMDTLLKKLV